MAVAEYEQSIQTAFREVMDALAATDTLRRQEDAQRAQATSSQAALALSEARYRGGVDNHICATWTRSAATSPTRSR